MVSIMFGRKWEISMLSKNNILYYYSSDMVCWLSIELVSVVGYKNLM